VGEILDLGARPASSRIRAWFSYDSQRLGSGRENSKAFLKANPTLTAKIEAAIRRIRLIAEQISQAPPSATDRWRRGAGED